MSESIFRKSRRSFRQEIHYNQVVAPWACSSAGRAPALQESRQNHTSAASGVAYAETRGATSTSRIGLKLDRKLLSLFGGDALVCSLFLTVAPKFVA